MTIHQSRGLAEAGFGQCRKWRGGKGPLTLAVLLVLFLGLQSPLRAGWLSQLFGPPSVDMNETYAPRPEGPTFDHSQLDRVLKRYVDSNGGVDYSALADDPDPLHDYTASLRGGSVRLNGL